MDRKESARLGGLARAAKLSPERRSEIARMGFDALVAKRYGGVRRKAARWLAERGLLALDLPMTTEELHELARRLNVDPDRD